METCKTLLLVLMLFCLRTTIAELDCFYPDGNNATNLIACTKGEGVSHCCRDSDVCLTHGLCFSSELGSVVRRGCTDATWESPNCPNICNTGRFRSRDAVLMPWGAYDTYICQGKDDALSYRAQGRLL